MKIPTLQIVNSDNFNQLDVTRQVITHDFPHQFALLDLGENLGKYGINWNSEWLTPHLALAPDNSILWLGIEQKIVSIGLKKGHLLLSLPLNSYLIQLLYLEQELVALTEQDVLIFNPKGSIRFSQALPEIGIGMTLEQQDLVIKLSDGESVLFDLQTYQFSSEQLEQKAIA